MVHPIAYFWPKYGIFLENREWGGRPTLDPPLSEADDIW